MCHFLQIKSVLFSPDAIEGWSRSFREITSRLISKKSVARAGPAPPYFDVVRDVINLAPVYWIAEDIVRIVFTLMFYL